MTIVMPKKDTFTGMIGRKTVPITDKYDLVYESIDSLYGDLNEKLCEYYGKDFCGNEQASFSVMRSFRRYVIDDAMPSYDFIHVHYNVHDPDLPMRSVDRIYRNKDGRILGYDGRWRENPKSYCNW